MSHHHHNADLLTEVRETILCDTCRAGIFERITGVTPPALERWFRLVEIHGHEACGRALTAAHAEWEAERSKHEETKGPDGLEA